MSDTPDRIGPTPERMARAIGEDGKPMITEIELGSDNVNWKAHRLNDAPLGRLRFCERPKISADQFLSLIHISEPTRPCGTSRMPSSA